MATKIGTDSSAMNMEAARQLTQDIMDGSFEVGAIDRLNSVIKDASKKDNFPSYITCQYATGLSRRVADLVERVAEWELRLNSEPISSIDGVAREFLTTQFNTVNEAFKESKSSILDTFDVVIELSDRASKKALPVFERAVSQYLQTRDSRDYFKAKECGRRIEYLIQTVAMLAEKKAYLGGRTVQYPLKEELTKGRIDVLQWLIGLSIGEFRCLPVENKDKRGCDYPTWEYEYGYSTVGNACVILDVLSSDEYVYQFGLPKEIIDDCIDDLQKKIGSDQVNYWVWELSGRKAGENYGEIHRYDDPRILKEAILRTARSLVDKLMNEKAVGLDQEAVYVKLFELIGAPEVENPMGWMKENACYYYPALELAIEQMKFSERQFEVIAPLGQSDMAVEDAEPKLRWVMEDIKFYPSTRATLDLSKNHGYTQVLNELSIVGNGPTPSELRKQIEKMISELSEKGQADTINYEVWRLGGEMSGENWGVVHR
ncbi:MAG: hypothetical protein JSR93_02270 [Verrucomicrobia bacterium]|nr:hypothetical protein [Verrucomicrobiota bacterium]